MADYMGTGSWDHSWAETVPIYFGQFGSKLFQACRQVGTLFGFFSVKQGLCSTAQTSDPLKPELLTKPRSPFNLKPYSTTLHFRELKL